jgi:carbon storage regulator
MPFAGCVFSWKEFSMLVLSRRAGEVIRIGDDIRIMIVRTGPLSVRVGIQAPRDLNILREELKPKEENEAKNEVS